MSSIKSKNKMIYHQKVAVEREQSTPHKLNKGLNSEFLVGKTENKHLRKAGWHAGRKAFENNYKDEDKSLNIISLNNDTSYQNVRQKVQLSLEFLSSSNCAKYFQLSLGFTFLYISSCRMRNIYTSSFTVLILYGLPISPSRPFF